MTCRLFLMAGTERLELTSMVLETIVLPLNYIPMVGETGFEPATPWSQTKCDTKLRYSPKWLPELDSNQRVVESKSTVLPLHHLAIYNKIKSTISVLVSSQPHPNYDLHVVLHPLTYPSTYKSYSGNYRDYSP